MHIPAEGKIQEASISFNFADSRGYSEYVSWTQQGYPLHTGYREYVRGLALSMVSSKPEDGRDTTDGFIEAGQGGKKEHQPLALYPLDINVKLRESWGYCWVLNLYFILVWSEVIHSMTQNVWMCRHCGEKFTHHLTTQIERISPKHMYFHTYNASAGADRAVEGCPPSSS